MDLVLLRPAVVYGPGDLRGLMPRVVCAAAYVPSPGLGEKMKLLWDAKMRVSTVHVDDVVRAVWAAAVAPRAALPSPPVFNLADGGHTDQGALNAALGRMFAIRTGFHGTILSNIARLRLEEVVQDANDKHMAPWSALCRAHGVSSGTPLSPYIHSELLRHNHLFIDGSAVTAPLGRGGLGLGAYAHPVLDEAALRASVQLYIDMKLFPPVLS